MILGLKRQKAWKEPLMKTCKVGMPREEENEVQTEFSQLCLTWL